MTFVNVIERIQYEKSSNDDTYDVKREPVKVNTVRSLGAAVRSARRDKNLTQDDLARRLGVSRQWVVRLEQGHPRVEAQKMLDALDVLGLGLDLTVGTRPADEDIVPDPFEVLFGKERG